MTKKESEFRQQVLDGLRTMGCMAVAIETKTQVGVPDVFYVEPNGLAGWIELKVMDEDFDRSKVYYTIPFRPGQQLFAAQFYAKSSRSVKCWVRFNDGMYNVDMRRMYPRNKVPVAFISKKDFLHT